MVVTIAQDMKRLTEDMIAANDARRRAVGTLLRETRATLQGFGADRTKRATEQAKDLAAFVGELSQRVQQTRRTAQDLLGEFDKANRQTSKDQAERLTDYVQDLVREVTSTLRRFDKERAHMSRELGARLDGEIAEIKAAVEQILTDAARFVSGHHTGMIQARQAWQQMSAAIRQTRQAGYAASTAGARHRACAASQATRKTRRKKIAARKKD